MRTQRLPSPFDVQCADDMKVVAEERGMVGEETRHVYYAGGNRSICALAVRGRRHKSWGLSNWGMKRLHIVIFNSFGDDTGSY